MKIQKAAKTAFFAAAISVAVALHGQAQSVDALLDKLVEKGILSTKEADDLKTETANQSAKDFNKEFAAMTGMPDWVTSLKFNGDFRGRYENISSDNESFVNRTRLRYRLRFGVTAAMLDDFEVGFRLGSGDSSGNPLSNNTTLENNGTKKPIWVDLAYGKWSPVHNSVWTVSTTIGKLVNPFQLSWMVFDPDYTPEGMAIQAAYKINDSHSLKFNGGAFVLDEVAASGHDPFYYGGQVIWDAKWSPKLQSSLSFSALDIVNKDSLANSPPTGVPPSGPNAGGVPDNNAGNTRGVNLNDYGALLNNYNPVIAGASFTYTLDSFPLYKGKFPIKPAGEFMKNPGASDNNKGYWAGITFGKSGRKGTWDISYRYQWLEADAWYEELVNDDNGAYYYVPSGSANPYTTKSGFFGGTNIKGHLIMLNYSITDSLTFSLTGYFNDLIINPNPATAVVNGSTIQTGSGKAVHCFADLMWKF